MTGTAIMHGVGGVRARRGVMMVRIAFGTAWAADAAMKWLPGFVHGTFLSTLRAARAGQPASEKAWIDVFVGAFRADPTAWAYALAVVETLLAVCVLAGAFMNASCVFGAWLSLGIWTTAEGFGGPYQNGSTDVSASIIYVMMFGLLFATAAGGTGGADVWLRPRLGRLRWLSSPGWAPAPRAARGRTVAQTRRPDTDVDSARGGVAGGRPVVPAARTGGPAGDRPAPARSAGPSPEGPGAEGADTADTGWADEITDLIAALGLPEDTTPRRGRGGPADTGPSDPDRDAAETARADDDASQVGTADTRPAAAPATPAAPADTAAEDAGWADEIADLIAVFGVSAADPPHRARGADRARRVGRTHDAGRS